MPQGSSDVGPVASLDVVREPDERAPIFAPSPPPPISGGSLTITQDGGTAVIGDPDRGLVWLVDLANDFSVRQVELPGAESGRIVESQPGTLHVLLRNQGALATFQADGTGVTTTSVCAAPRGLTYDAGADRLLVACRDGQLLALDRQTQSSELLAQLPTDLRDVIVLNDTSGTRIMVSRFRSAELLELTADGSVVQTSAPPQRQGVVGDRLNGEEPAPLVAPNVAWRSIGAFGQVMMLHQHAVTTELDTEHEGGYGGDCAPVVDAAITTVSSLGTVTSVNLLPGGLAVDMALSPDGKWVAIANAGVRDPEAPRLFFIEEGDGEVSVAGSPVGSSASPIVALYRVLGQGDELRVEQPGNPCDGIVANGVSGVGAEQATSVAFNPAHSNELHIFVRQPAALITVDVTEPANGRRIELMGSDVTDTGHDLFHRVDTSIACAHCHPEGGDDGHVWNFGDVGERRTQSLEGGVSPPFHWDGALVDASALMGEVFERRMSAAPQSEPRQRALFDWIGALPTPAPSPATDGAGFEAGRALFESAELACATCHSGERLTDGAFHDVGTAELPMKTPSLRGVALRLPLMHTGCAETLTDRFDDSCGGGDAHGRTSQLSATELANLVTYLQAL